MMTKQPCICLILVFLVIAGCVWGDFYYVGRKCDDDVLEECKGEKGCVDIADCREAYGVGCIEGESFGYGHNNAACGQKDSKCDYGELFCLSATEVAICHSNYVNVIAKRFDCPPGEVCFEGDCHIEE